MIAEIDAVASAVVVGLAVAAAGQDAWTRTIDNRFSLAILVLFGLGALAGVASGSMALDALAWAVGGGLVVFCIGLALFSAGALGGGDVKLLTALAPWIAPHHALAFLTVMAIAGGVVAVVTLALLWLNRKTATKQSFMNDFFTSLGNDRDSVPYGVAIAIGAGATWMAGGLGLPGLSGGAG